MKNKLVQNVTHQLYATRNKLNSINSTNNSNFSIKYYCLLHTLPNVIVLAFYRNVKDCIYIAYV